MMRSLYSGVSGLKIHQTKMDVIGNNIANVNTIGFKSSTVNFADVYYQNLQSATGPNPTTGAAGTNAKQIGLGANLAAINVNITGIGGTQRTDRGSDLMINGDAFFVVESAGQTYFTKAGAMGVDPSGNLYCTSNGATVLGWQTDANGDIIKDTVSALKITTPDRMYSPPEATTYATLSGNVYQNDKNVVYDPEGSGLIVPVSFYDRLGNQYTLKLSLMQHDTSGLGTPEAINAAKAAYTVSVADIVDVKNKSILYTVTDNNGIKTYEPTALKSFTLNGVTFNITVDDEDGMTIQPDTGGAFPDLTFNGSTGAFEYVGSAASGGTGTGDTGNGRTLNFSLNDATDPDAINPFPNEGIEIDFSKLTMYSESGSTLTSNVEGNPGDADGNRAGFAAGSLDGYTIGTDGKIFGIYTNGVKRCFGQIALATFANPSGLESVGNSMFRTTLNSGEFDGVGVDPDSVGGISTGALEMSNVDLATEFTSMITTQRGFQANSRIITTSDSILEELINLKR